MDAKSNSGDRDWSSLPGDIVYDISKRMEMSRIETLGLRAVCRTYRNVIPLPPRPISPYPHLKLPLPPKALAHPSLRRGHLLLTQSTLYAIQPKAPLPPPPPPPARATKSNVTNKKSTWFIQVRELSSGRAKFKHAFDIGFSNNHLLPKSLNLLDYRVKELTKSYGLEYVHVGERKKDHDAALHTVTFLKAIVSSSRSTLDEMVIDDGFAIMASSGEVLLVWRKDDENWTPIEFEDEMVGDIAYHNEKFYALSIDGVFLSVHPKTLDVTKLANFCGVSCAFAALGMFSYMVKSSCTEEFFVIYRNYAEDHYYDYDCGYDSENRIDDVYLFRLDIEKMDNVNNDENSIFNCASDGLWMLEHEVDNLRGGVLFCSEIHSLFFSSAEALPGCKRDCIYFNGESIFKMWNHCERRRRLLDLCARDAKIFWPPPTWVRNSSLSPEFK